MNPHGQPAGPRCRRPRPRRHVSPELMFAGTPSTAEGVGWDGGAVRSQRSATRSLAAGVDPFRTAGWRGPSCSLVFRMDRRDYPTRKLRLGDPEGDGPVGARSASERVMMVWQLTLQAWAFKEDLRDEPRLRRDVGRVVRRGG